MLRKKSDGGFERQDADGNWVAVSADEAKAATAGTAVSPEPQVEESGVATMLDSLIDELHGAGDQNGKAAEVAEVQAQQGLIPDNIQAEADSGPGSPDGNGTVLDTESVPGDFDLEVPGLVSTDKGRSTRGFQTVKERLKANAKKRREPKKIEVGSAAAKVTGPAKSEGTERRQARRAQERLEAGRSTVGVGEAGLKQRYVNRPAPALMGDRPKWVQDLFETHFRSEHTLGMRRAFNRMKISRQDYAIGWLTAFDKFREEPSLLRARNGSGE